MNVNMEILTKIKKESASLQSVIVKEEYAVEHEYEGQIVTPQENKRINEFPHQTKCEVIDWNSLPWICQFCDRSLYGYRTFKSHINSSHERTALEHIHHKCIDCGEVFNSYLLFINHIRMVHYECLRLSCDVCCEIYSDYKELSDHRDQHSNEVDALHPVVHYCLGCEEIFSFVEELEDHFQNTHSSVCNPSAINEDIESTNQYDNCKVQSESEEYLECSRKDGRRYECMECKKDFASLRNLKDHERLHTGELPFKCQFCGTGFRTKRNLKTHMLKHTGKKLFKCKVCEKEFTHKHTLTIHMRRHTGECHHVCPICSKSYPTAQCLKSHFVVHVDERPYKCEFCSKTFSRQRELKNHIPIHAEPRFKCEICSMLLKSAISLKCHIRKHTGEQPYECEVCKKAFTCLRNLQEHLSIHTGERPFKCAVCEKNFRTQGDLKVHSRVHTGERSHKCEECSKCFPRLLELKRHIRIHTGRFMCEICKAKFKHSHILKRHMEKQHREEKL